MRKTALLLMLCCCSLIAELKVVVTVSNPKTGKVIRDLKSSDFEVTDGGSQVPVLNVEKQEGLIDYVLLLDNSLIGGAVRPLATDLVEQLKSEEQMSVISFASSASIAQDFTSNKQLLLHSIQQLKYEDSPRVFDSLYAAIDGGFRGSSFRRVILLLTAGVEGPSRTSDREVIRLAYQNKVSIYPIFVAGYGKGLLEQLARRTAGASFYLKDLQKSGSRTIAQDVMETSRFSYLLTLRGNLPLSEKAKISVPGKQKLLVSFLPLE